MSTQDMDILARKIVSLEKRHNALARAQQLPNSSVRLVDGDDVGLAESAEATKDIGDEAAYLGDWLTDADNNLDDNAKYGVEVPEWIQDAGHAGDVAWDSTQFATDLALTLDTELTQARQELEQAQIDLDQALADSATALQEAQEALQEAEDAVTAVSAATAAAGAAEAAAQAAQTAAGTAQTAADQAAADALAAANAASDAQGAADDAQATADAKGKVIIQPGAPNAADRLPQNLWIDTSGGNNTPKRWDGSNWVVVTDKAATDAAAAAVTAQDRADEAYDEALSAATAAGNAQASADGKSTNWYQNDAPAGTAHKVGDTWFDTNDGNRVHRWDGSNWVTAQFGTNAISDTAINATKLAANAVTEGKILNGAITNDKLDSAVQNAIATAQSTASNAQTVANNAQSVASAAQTAASNAQDDADQAISDAAAAAGIAGGKADVLIQNTAPPAAMRKATTLWIDTTGGANTPKRWVSGTTWAAVTDKAATDAAAAAATAQSAANAAHSRADDAHTIASGAATAASAAQSAASAAQTAANNAQTTANGKNKIVRSTGNASNPGNYVAGDQWWKYSGSQITAMWIHSGSAWVSQTLTDSVITNLNAGSITAGTIASARLSATNIKAVLINAGAIQTANIAAGAITAASGIIADLAIGTAKIIDGSITSAKIDDLAVTNAKIANGTIQNAKIANLDAAKITTGELAAARVKMDAAFINKMAANKILVSGDNLIKNTDFTGGGWTRTNSQNSVVFASVTGPSGKPAVVGAASGSTTYAAYYAGTTSHNSDWVIPVNGAEEFRASVWVYSATAIPANKIGIGVVRYTETYARSTASSHFPSSIPANTWSQVSVTLTTASNTRSIGVYFPISSGHSSDVYFSDPELVRKATGELIVDGAITATKISTGAVVADKIASNAVTAVKINANAVTTAKINAGAVNADKIASNAVTAVKIAANAVIAGKIQAQAIDGMTITGALLRTASSGQRMQFDVNGLRAFNSSGGVTATLTSAVGGLQLRGGLDSRSSTSNAPHTIVTNSGISVLHQLGASGAGSDIFLDRSGLSSSGPMTISADGPSAALTLRATSVYVDSAFSIRGDTAGVISLPGSAASGVTTVTTNDLEIRSGWVIIVVNVNRSIPNNSTTDIWQNLPNYLRPVANRHGAAWMSGSHSSVAFVRPNGTIAVANQSGSTRTATQCTITYPLP